jgi:DNA-binding MarR family transcriptional regulator
VSAPRVKKTRSRSAAAPPHVREALDAFRHIVQALRVGRAGERQAGLSSAQVFALQQIGDHPDASVNDIAALTHTHQSSVSVVIQRLVRRRLVAKVPSSEDRRRQRLALTAKGQRVLNDAPVAVQEHLIAAIAAVPATDRRVLARALGAIAKAISPNAATPHPPMFFEGPKGSDASRRR